MVAAVSRAPLSGLANLMALKGRDNDSMLVHLSPTEVKNLNALSGGTMSINPQTGLPEGRSRLLEAVLPALLSIGVGIATGGASIPAQMAAQAAAGYGGARLVGKEHDEALTSGAISGVTAGLFGGVGSDALAGGRELGRAGVKEGIKGTVPVGLQHVVKDTVAKEGADILAEQAAKDLALRQASEQSGNFLSPFFSSSGDVYGQIAHDMGKGGMSLGKALAQPKTMKGLTGILGKETAMNALVDQMRADANRPRDLSRPPTATGELWSQPYNFDLQGPYSQQDISGAYLGDSITPINFYNQGYAKEGGSVQHMAQGGLAGLPVRMLKGGDILKFLIPAYGLHSLLKGRKKSDPVQPTGQSNMIPIGQPQPQQIHLGYPMPQQMAFGGKLGKLLGIGGGSGSVSAGPRGSSQGGKGSGFFKDILQNPEVIALLQAQEGQEQPVQPMAGGGMMGDIPPELLEKLKAMAGQASAPAPRAYDQLAALGSNPMQQMQEGGLAGAAEAAGSIMPALQPLIEVASEEAFNAVAQPRTYAQTQPAQPFQAGGQPFEGRVTGQGDGMSDQIPFNIEGQQPALLSRDEYVIPADVVAMVGDGSSNAGADQFDNFIGNIRKMKYGRQVQPRELNQGLGSLLGMA